MTDGADSEDATSACDSPPSDGQPTDPGVRRARRVATGWMLLIVIASLVDPGAVFELVGAPATAGGGGAGGTAAFAVAHLVAYGVLAWLLVVNAAGATVGAGLRAAVGRR